METQTTHPTGSSIRRLIPVGKWTEHHAWPPIGGLRHLIFYADKNGFNKAIIRCGRRILIDENAFFEWLDGQQKHRV